jgi:hypothetical protein
MFNEAEALGLPQPEIIEVGMRVRLIVYLAEGEASKAELAQGLGHKSVSGELHKQVKILLELGYIAMTIPDKPRNSKQE